MAVEWLIDDCRIWIPHDWSAAESQNENIDVHVFLSSGLHYCGVLMTPQNAGELMLRHARTGENPFGNYLWVRHMVLVPTISKEAVCNAISLLVKSGEIEVAFGKVEALPEQG